MLLGGNDDSFTGAGAGGSTFSTDSFLEYTFTSPGLYVIGVGRFNSTGSAGGITGSAPLTGQTYTLQVSVEGAGGATLADSIQVVIPTGSASVDVDLASVQDYLVDGDQIAKVVAYAPRHASGEDTVVVTDSAQSPVADRDDHRAGGVRGRRRPGGFVGRGFGQCGFHERLDGEPSQP